MNKIYFYHIRKAGGTSLNEIFFELHTSDPSLVSEQIRKSNDKIFLINEIKYVGNNEIELKKQDYFYGFSHYPLHVYHPPEDAFTIALFRDPINRIISHYRMVVEYNVNNIERKWMSTEKNWLGNNFRDFYTKIPKERLINQLYTFSKSYSIEEAYLNILNCNHYFFNEEFDDGIKVLGAKLGLKLNSRHSHRTNVDVEILDEEKEELRFILNDEYKLLSNLKNCK